VIFVHDFADMFGHFAKGFGDTHFKSFNIFTAISMWVGWLYSRLIAFPWCIYHGVCVIQYTKPFVPAFVGTISEKLHHILFSFLFFLFLLNIWWFYLITIMIWRFATKGVTEDIQNIV
jgi:hypothetical protein